MRMRVVALLLLALLAGGAPVRADDPPTREEVLQALQAFCDGEGAERGEARIKAWGAQALPHLRALADDSRTQPIALQLMRAIRLVRTEEAVDLFVEVLEERTLTPGNAAVTEIYGATNLDGFFERLGANERFKPAVLAHARGPFRRWVAMMIERMRWVEQAPLLRTMLEDRDLDVREAAAQALRALTGETIEIARPALVFPAVDKREGMLGPARVLPHQGRRDPDFVATLRWFDGRPRLVYGFEPGIASLGDRGMLCVTTGALEEPETWPMPYDLEALVGVPTRTGERQLVGIVDVEEEGRASWQTVMAWRADGLERWRRRTDERFLEGLAVLYGGDGPIGIAIGASGDTGVVAVDLEGRPLWQVPRRYVLSELRTHADLPGHLLLVGGDATVFHHVAAEVEVVFELPRQTALYVSSGALFPGTDGRPAVVLAGKQMHGDVPTLCRLDTEGSTVWKAELPVAIDELALLESPGGPRLLALTTERGELMLVDEDGTLRWRGETPAADPENRVATYQLVAGAIGRSEYGVVVRHLGESYLYRLDPDALRPQEER